MPSRRNRLVPASHGKGMAATTNETGNRITSKTSSKIMESDGPGSGLQASVQRLSPSKHARAIPLRCYLCPNQPTFSDISHLLTHISSKSHLACRFKLELQKKSDDDAKNKLKIYEEWYDVNEIEDLLDNRMAAKKDKKSTMKTKASATGVKRRRSAMLANSPAAMSSNEGEQSQPRLRRGNASSGRASLHLHDARNDVKVEDSVESPSGDLDDIPSVLTASSGGGRKLRSSKPDGKTVGLNHRAAIVNPDTQVTDTGDARLKGAVFLGMGIFDAATPEQKRLRNQKKDPSVLQNMIATSRRVQHDKFVWDESFDQITRVRDIYASPSIDGSPEPERNVVKKTKKATTAKKKSGGRQTTVDNTNVRQTRSATKAAAQRGQHTNRHVEELELKLESSPELESMDDSSNNSLRSQGGEALDDVFRETRSRTAGAAGHIGSDWDPDNFELPPRQALQTMNSNTALTSPTPLIKQRTHSYVLSGNHMGQSNNMSYEMQPSVAGHGHFDQRSSLNNAGLNPLYQPPVPSGLPAPYGFPSYGQQGRGMNTFHPVMEPSPYNMLLGHLRPAPGAGNTAEFDL